MPVFSSDSGSSAGSGKAKRKSKPTSKAKHRKQKIKARYAKAREDAQLAGVIPTTPDGAVRDERVDPSIQGAQPLSELVAQAIRHGWATREEVKPELVEEMVKIVLDPDMSAKAKVASFNALRMADQSQWERDNPDAVKSKNGNNTTNIGSINIQNNVDAAAAIREMIQRGELGIIEEVQTPCIASASGGGGQQRALEAGAASEDDQQRISECMADAEQPTCNHVPVPAR